VTGDSPWGDPGGRSVSNGECGLKVWFKRRSLTWLVVVPALLVATCGDDAQAPTTTEVPITTEGPTTTGVATTPEPIETTSSVLAETTTSMAGSGDASALMTSDELCDLLPGAEIGALMNADARVTPFGGGPGVLCDLGIAWTGTSLHVIVGLQNNGGDDGFEEAVDFEARIFNIDPIAIAGVGDRAAGFGDRIIVQSGRSVVRIDGFPEELVMPQLEEIGRLIAAALG